MSVETFKKEISEIVRAINENDSFLIVGHIDPDGDCIGSMLALALFLRSKGKEGFCFTPGSIQDNFKNLPGAEMFIQEGKLKDIRAKVVFTLDAPTIARTADLVGFGDGRTVINIDHHPSNEMYGDINLVDSRASATAILVYRILSEISDESMTPEIADCLYLGILLDTGGFRFQNTNSEAHYTAGALIEKGARAYELAREFIYVKKLSTLKLLARALESLEVHSGGKVAFMTITRDMIENNGASMSETEGFVDYASCVDEVLLSALFRELSSTETRVSLRSRNEYDVAALASKLGGGGHRSAAGLTLHVGVEESKRVILSEFVKMLKQKEGL